MAYNIFYMLIRTKVLPPRTFEWMIREIQISNFRRPHPPIKQSSITTSYGKKNNSAILHSPCHHQDNTHSITHTMIIRTTTSLVASALCMLSLLQTAEGFLATHQSTAVSFSSIMTTSESTTSLSVMSRSRSSGRGADRSKRQERVGHLVRTELGRILHSGLIKGGDASDTLEDDLRQRISIVSADVSPDLRQARITVSVRDHKTTKSSQQQSTPDSSAAAVPSSAVMDKRRAFAWLVRNTKALKHSLAQKMSHMKTCPNLTFAQVDVAAAVDVMYLIDQVSAGAKRESVDVFDVGPNGVIEGIDFDKEDHDDDWLDEEDDDDFF